VDKWNELEIALRAASPALSLRREEPMARHTSFRIGGPARLMALPASPAELEAVCRMAWDLDIRFILIGNGTNLLAPDEGLDALVVKTAGCNAVGRAKETELCADCGAPIARVANLARVAGLSGLEFAGGIPGSVGGAVTMNAGAFGGEMKDVVLETAVLTPAGRRVFSNEEHGFRYRGSALPAGAVVLESRFRLRPWDPAEIGERMAAFAARRRAAQPTDLPSAGSTFKRPPGRYAAELIDKAGLKGLSVGGAAVSTKHAGFVVNTGGATCRDVLELTERIRKRVLETSGVALELEVKVLR